jgi:hypothetical protein
MAFCEALAARVAIREFARYFGKPALDRGCWLPSLVERGLAPSWRTLSSGETYQPANASLGAAFSGRAKAREAKGPVPFLADSPCPLW